MGAERWIVFLVLASLGGGIYIMSYLVDEESLERYGKRVAEYNAQHHETMMDAAMHKIKRGSEINQPVESEEPQFNDAVTADHPLSENDRLMRARLSDGEDVESGRDKRSFRIVAVEKPDEIAPARRPSRQGTNEPDVDRSYKDIARSRRSSGQGIDEDPNHPPGQTAIVGRSSRQGMNPEDSDPLREIVIEKASMQDNQPKDEGHRKPLEIADLYASSENDDAREDQMTLSRNNLLVNYKADGFASDRFESGDLWKSEQSSAESHEDSDDSDSKYWMPYSGNREDLALLSRHLLSSDDDTKLISFNKGIDFILGLMNTMFSMEGEASVPLPALNQTFGHGIMQGRFEASQGFFGNPATLHRTGDVAIVKNGNSVGLEVALGLATLAAGYNQYDLGILKIHQNGRLDVSVAENSVKMKISLTYFPNCKVDVNYLELNQLGGIKVDITGLGAFQSMFDMLSKWLLDNFTNDFRTIVNKKLIEKAKKAVARQDICKYFPLDLL